nr:MAG TPA: hypothetical protein [Caudoviricetes sp.]
MRFIFCFIKRSSKLLLLFYYVQNHFKKNSKLFK